MDYSSRCRGIGIPDFLVVTFSRAVMSAQGKFHRGSNGNVIFYRLAGLRVTSINQYTGVTMKVERLQLVRYVGCPKPGLELSNNLA